MDAEVLRYCGIVVNLFKTGEMDIKNIGNVPVSGFAGRSDEVYGIVLPAINEMKAEIETVTTQLKRDLGAIVEKEVRIKLKKILSDIEKATVYKSNWREKEKRKMRTEIQREIKEKQQEVLPTKPKRNVAKKVVSRNLSRSYSSIQKSHAIQKPHAKIGDEILYCGQNCKVISRKKEKENGDCYYATNMIESSLY